MPATIGNLGEQTIGTERKPYDAEGPLTMALDLATKGVHAIAGLMHHPADYPNPAIPKRVLDRQPKGPAYAARLVITTGARAVGQELARGLHGYDMLADEVKDSTIH